ncbi:MAG: hypothetical protein AAFR76_09025 [Planctomycetota bacterium]
MRRIVDLMALLTIVAIAAAWYVTRDTGELQNTAEQARQEVDRLRAAVLLRSQSDRHLLNKHGWPLAIDPAWFGTDDLPMNPLVDADRPWLEVAAPEQTGWQHPRPIFVVDRSTAMFWYNPALGIVRARVELQGTDGQTISLYNATNNAKLTSINPTTFGDDDTIDLTSIDISDDITND